MTNQSSKSILQALKSLVIRKDYALLFLLLLVFLLLICAFLPSWVSANRPETELPFSLHSVKEANYQPDREYPTLPAISLKIIEDVMRDNNTSEEEITVRIATLSSSLLTPVPRSTGIVSVPNTPVPVSTIAPAPTFSTTRSPAPTSLAPTAGQPIQAVPTTAAPTPVIVYNPTTLPTEEEEPSPAISLTCSLTGYVDNDSSGSITYQDDLQYQFIVTNSGNVPLSNVHINDNSFGGTISCPAIKLQVNASMTCSPTTLHTITLTEANAGSVTANATALGAYDGKSYSKSISLSTIIAQNPAITLDKNLLSYDDNDLSITITEGDALWYGFRITNTGNVSVDTLSVTDDTFALTVNCPTGVIDPGAFADCAAASAHIVTTAEASAAYVSNAATASAQFNGSTYTNSDTLITTVIPTTPNPMISLDKSLASYDDLDSSGSISLGDDLYYQFSVFNSGNVPLLNIQITDITYAIPITCPASFLLPANNMICTADSTYTISVADAIAGQITNNATASGMFLTTTYTNSDSLVTNITQGTGLISGYVLEDTDNDGDLNDPDSGIVGVTIQLTKKNEFSNLYATTTTDANGFFSFTALPPADYSVLETDPSEYTSTADSDGLNDNIISHILNNGENKADLVFLDHDSSSECSAPDSVNGFVASTIPANGAANVSMSTTTLTVTYNQAMMSSGGQSIDRTDKYQFRNQDTNGTISITGVTYNPGTYTAVLSIDTIDPDWLPANTYELTIKTVQNVCGTAQSSITRTFTTQ